MGIRKIKEKKYTAQLDCRTWHAAGEVVYEKGKKHWIFYSDIDGDHCYFHRLHEYLEAGWDILKMEGQLSVVLTGDNWPFVKQADKRVRNAIRGYIIQYPEYGEKWDRPDRPRLCGEKIVEDSYFDLKKVDKVVEETINFLKKKPMEESSLVWVSA